MWGSFTLNILYYLFCIFVIVAFAKVVGQRSRLNAKKCVLASLLACFKVNGRGQGQRSGSRSNSGTQQSMLGARLSRVQQRAITTNLEQRRIITSPSFLFVCL